MGFLTALTEIRDEITGKRVDSPQRDGTYLPIVLSLGAGLSYVATKIGGVTKVAVSVSLSSLLASLVSQVLEVASLKIGPLQIKAGTATTTGTGSDTLLTIELPADRVFMFDVRIVAFSTGLGYYASASAPGDGMTTGGTPSDFGPADPVTSAMGIAPVTGQSYGGGALTIVVSGPQATISGIADDGGGFCQVTVDGSPIDASLVGQSVTIAGVTGTTEANGAHTVTAAGSNSFVLDVAFVNPYTGGPGTVRHTTPPTVDYAGYIITLAP